MTALQPPNKWYWLEWDGRKAVAYRVGRRWHYVATSDWFYNRPAHASFLIYGRIEMAFLEISEDALVPASVIFEHEIENNPDAVFGAQNTWTTRERQLLIVDGHTLIDQIIIRPGRFGESAAK